MMYTQINAKSTDKLMDVDIQNFWCSLLINMLHEQEVSISSIRKGENEGGGELKVEKEKEKNKKGKEDQSVKHEKEMQCKTMPLTSRLSIGPA